MIFALVILRLSRTRTFSRTGAVIISLHSANQFPRSGHRLCRLAGKQGARVNQQQSRLHTPQCQTFTHFSFKLLSGFTVDTSQAPARLAVGPRAIYRNAVEKSHPTACLPAWPPSFPAQFARTIPRVNVHVVLGERESAAFSVSLREAKRETENGDE